MKWSLMITVIPTSDVDQHHFYLGNPSKGRNNIIVSIFLPNIKNKICNKCVVLLLDFHLSSVNYYKYLFVIFTLWVIIYSIFSF